MGVLIIIPFIGFIASEIARIQLGSGIGITLLDLSVGLFGFIYLTSRLLQKKPLFSEELRVPVLVVVAVMIFSLLMNAFMLQMSQAFIASLYIIRWFAYILMLGWAVQQTSKEKVILERFMLVSGSIIVLLGVIQYLFYQNLRNLFYLGWDDHLYRLFSTFLDPNYAGVFLVLFVLFLLPNVLKNLRKKITPLCAGYIFLTVVSFFSVLLTYSRTAFIMLVIGVVTLLFLKQKKWLALISIGLILLSIFLTSNFKIEGLNPFRTASSTARILSMRDAVAIIEDNLFFGVGFNAYRYAQIRYHFRLDATPFPSHADAGTDNSYLFILATMGVLGLGAYLYFLSILGKSSFIRSRTSDRSVVFFASLIALGVGSIFINALFYPPILFWMWMLYGISGE